MSFKREKLKIIIRKNVMRIRPSIRLNATEGRTGCKYVRTLDHALLNQGIDDPSSVELAVSAPVLEVSAEALPTVLVAAGGAVAQPAAMNNAFVNNSGAATKSRMLKINAKMIDPAAAAVVPFFSSSRERF